MSQDTFPFDGGPEPVGFNDADSDRNKKLLMGGGVVAALVLGAGAYLFLGGSGSSEDLAFTPVTHSPRAVTAVAKPVTPTKKLPTAYKEQIGRDPFKALYVVSAAAAAPAAGAPAAPVTTGTTPVTTGTGPTTTGTTTTGTSTTPVTPVTKRYTLKLVSISKPSPEVRYTTWAVDGQNKTVLPAQRFGKYGELVVLAFSKNAQGVVDKVVLQVGDDSPVEVAVKDSISVL